MRPLRSTKRVRRLSWREGRVGSRAEQERVGVECVERVVDDGAGDVGFGEQADTAVGEGVGEGGFARCGGVAGADDGDGIGAGGGGVEGDEGGAGALFPGGDAQGVGFFPGAGAAFPGWKTARQVEASALAGGEGGGRYTSPCRTGRWIRGRGSARHRCRRGCWGCGGLRDAGGKGDVPVDALVRAIEAHGQAQAVRAASAGAWLRRRGSRRRRGREGGSAFRRRCNGGRREQDGRCAAD